MRGEHRDEEYTVQGLRTFLKDTEYHEFTTWLTGNLKNFLAHDGDRNGAMSRQELQQALHDYVAYKAGSSAPAAPTVAPHRRPVASEVEPIPGDVIDAANRVFASLDPTKRGAIGREQFAEAMASPPRARSPSSRSRSPGEGMLKRTRGPARTLAGSELELTAAQARHELQRLFLEYGHMNPGAGLDQLREEDCAMDLRELSRFATAHGMVPAFVKPMVLKAPVPDRPPP